MTNIDAEKKAQEFNKLIGQRWQHKINGSIETVINVKAEYIQKTENGWAVLIEFIPSIENGFAKISGCTIDKFFEEYSIFN